MAIVTREDACAIQASRVNLVLRLLAAQMIAASKEHVKAIAVHVIQDIWGMTAVLRLVQTNVPDMDLADQMVNAYVTIFGQEMIAR